MSKRAWVGLTARERAVLIDALASVRKTKRIVAAEIDALTVKLVHFEPNPSITVGVHGGQVQWAIGNPFPIRICDYDGDREELPDLDEQGHPCRIWFEPATKAKTQTGDRSR
jgi:hypothetical protein